MLRMDRAGLSPMGRGEVGVLHLSNRERSTASVCETAGEGLGPSQNKRLPLTLTLSP